MIATHQQTKYFKYGMTDFQEEMPEFLRIVEKAFFTQRLDIKTASDIISAHKSDNYEAIKDIVNKLNKEDK